jgi:acyl-homoserine lactone acylase PvdQ
MKRVIAGLAATAALAAPSAAAADTTLNIVPWGAGEPGVPWASSPGVLPLETQALMYDRLTPLYRDVTDAQLVPSTDGTGYFKSEALLDRNDPSLITTETAAGSVPGRPGTLTATVRRDSYGVPHIYSDTDDGVVFGAGWVIAEDRNLLLSVARDNAYAAAIDLPGVSTVDLILNLGQFTPSAAVKSFVDRTQTRALRRAGAAGRRVLHDIDTYVAGANAWLKVNQPATPPLTRTDIYALNAFKGQFLGEGGGEETKNALALAQFQKSLGTRRGFQAYEDLRQRNDPGTSHTINTKAFPYQTRVKVQGARGRVALKRGSFVAEGPPAAQQARALPARREASNALLLTGSRTADGKPLMVAGPQLPYTYPGFTIEMGLYGPGIRTRGVTSAPFPGYMLIGRSATTAWSLTSAGVDIVDTYAERLCRGSKTRYTYKGKCRKMTSLRAGTLKRGSSTVSLTERFTVHGPVIGYARDGKGRRIALSRKRSSFGRDTTDQLFFQKLTLDGGVKTARDFIRAAGLSPQTFNAFFVSNSEIAMVTTGRAPIRAKGVNPDLPVDGRGRFEWKGFLPLKRHPQAINPSDGMLVNWNNKPARSFPAGDERWSEGSIARNELLTGELARTAKHTPATVTAAMNAAATEDVRIVELWPVLAKVLDRGTSPSARATAMRDQLQAWHDAGGSRLDADLDGRIDAPGAAILDEAWTGMARFAMCGRLGQDGCNALATRMNVFDQPPGGQYGGWHQYLDKDLRRLLGEKVRGPLQLRYCGRGSVSACAKGLWAALDGAGARLEAAQGPDPAAWRKTAERTSFVPLPLTEIRYTNRPSGIQQVIKYDP